MPRLHGVGAGARRILVLSGDVLPYPGLPTTGAGLRAWGIAHGLASAGHDVTLLMPEHVLTPLSLTDEQREQMRAVTFDSARCDDAIARWRPDVIVVQHWWLATLIQPGEIPLVVDLHGPLLLETLYQNHAQYESLASQKIQALSRADFITCAGEEQRKYFYPWLMLAGFDLREHVIAAVPVSLSPDLPTHEPDGEVSFVYGGIYLPWQNPLVALSTLVERLEAHQRGRLHFYGGAHPVLKLAAAEVETIERQIAASDRVVAHGLVSHDQLLAQYRHAHVAFDVMARNPERELAFTTRTVEYLWCGLPVVYNNYAELARYIGEAEAGWTVDPLDRAAIGAVVDTILTDPGEVARRGANARRLVRERLTWDRAIAPLDAFCRSPHKRRPRPLHLSVASARPDPAALPPDLDLLVTELEAASTQIQLTNQLLDQQASVRPSPPTKVVGQLKRVVKSRLGVDRRLVLADHGASLAGDLSGGASHGQSFVLGAGQLYRIDVVFATFGRLNASHVRFRLCPVTPTGMGPDLITQHVPAAHLHDNRFYSFIFPALELSPGRRLAFWLDSPDATPETAVAVWFVASGAEALGQRFVRGTAVDGHLLCRIVEHPVAEAAAVAVLPDTSATRP
jgi:glycosyltransferase involved in cell wall biosynthesis